MIVLMTFDYYDEKTNKKHLLVSHGIDLGTGKVVVLPSVTPQEIGARFDEEMCEYVLD